MLSSIKDDNIVKGIPTYILAISLIVPIILFSGVIGGIQMGPGSASGGMYDFLYNDWRTWSDGEWDILFDLLEQYDEHEDLNSIPAALAYFIEKMDNMSEDERDEFTNELIWRLFIKS